MSNIKKAAFAGGCFWCMVKPFKELVGVLEVVSGYTGGEKENPTYEDVTSQTTGHYEAVEITYDENRTSYRELVDIFLKNIDPTDRWGQFHDRGQSYRTAIFYHDETQRKIAEELIHELNKSGRFAKPVATKLIPASIFYPAEEYHQDYYIKNPLRYKMYYKGSGREAFIEDNWNNNTYDKKELKNILSPIQYKVTQENGTEPPFDNEYNEHFEEGIYVDVISGTPLFSSRDKFKCGCGWPAFSKPINNTCIKEKEDLSHGMIRTEVRSTSSNSHLGHVFTDDLSDMEGLRYCINSAALRFIPMDKLKQERYEDYINMV